MCAFNREKTKTQKGSVHLKLKHEKRRVVLTYRPDYSYGTTLLSTDMNQYLKMAQGGLRSSRKVRLKLKILSLNPS